MSDVDNNPECPPDVKLCRNCQTSYTKDQFVILILLGVVFQTVSEIKSKLYSGLAECEAAYPVR